jgi:hypothetical protein
MTLPPTTRPLRRGTFRYDVYRRIDLTRRALTPKQVSDLLGFTDRHPNAQPGDGYTPRHAKKRLAVFAILFELAESGHIRKAARGLYTSWEDKNQYDQTPTLASRVRAQFEEHSVVYNRELIKLFPKHSGKTIRSVLYRLEEEEVIEKVARGAWTKCNVIALDQYWDR